MDKAVFKEFDGLPRQQYRHVVSTIVDLLADPTPHHSRPLEGSAYRRIVVGEYRVVYRTDESFIYVVVAGKRNDGDIDKLRQTKDVTAL